MTHRRRAGELRKATLTASTAPCGTMTTFARLRRQPSMIDA
jgi:hypothetical protein